ncbi:MAG: 4Fe-4S dicluster domain-containing protein [Raoultibacter sp.]
MATEQYGFYVDTSRCIKCWSCVVSCKQWHEIKANTVSRRKVKEEDIGTFPDVKRKFTSLSCMHCADPACLKACPQGAISKREEDGIVVVDAEKCIKCGTCIKACPFGVPELDDKMMNKCDACLGLGRAADEEPHCVKSCVTKALHFGTMTDMAALAEKKGGAQMEGVTGPSVYLS